MAEQASTASTNDATPSVADGLAAPLESSDRFATFTAEDVTFAQLQAPVGGAAKRAIDIAGALAALIFLAPVMLLCAAAIAATSRGPVIFAHQRIGFGGRRFPCLKFRTMWQDADVRLGDILNMDERARREWSATQKLAADPRVTAIGRFLRTTSLDELPQLFNVLVGQMSLIGPRPIVDSEVSRYGSAFHYYVRTRPGITGLWQVSGRSTTSYGERVELDKRYASDWSLLGDLKIAAQTVVVVLQRTGAH